MAATSPASMCRLTDNAHLHVESSSLNISLPINEPNCYLLITVYKVLQFSANLILMLEYNLDHDDACF